MTSLHLLEERWHSLPLEKIEEELHALILEAGDDDQKIAILHAYLARAQILQLKMTLAGESLQIAGPLLGSRMDKSRVLFFIERGRLLIARGKVKHGVDQWANALHIAKIAGDPELTEEVLRLIALYRDMSKETQVFPIEEMQAYVENSVRH